MRGGEFFLKVESKAGFYSGLLQLETPLQCSDMSWDMQKKWRVKAIVTLSRAFQGKPLCLQKDREAKRL